MPPQRTGSTSVQTLSLLLDRNSFCKMDTERGEHRAGLEQRVRLLEAELEAVQRTSVTWGIKEVVP